MSARVHDPLPYLGDDALLLAELHEELERLAIVEPVLLRASERSKLERVLAYGTDRGGYPGDRRWRYDESIAHADVILATTPEQNLAGEGDAAASTSLKKFAGIDEPLLLVYAAAAFERLRDNHHRFRAPAAKLAALRAVFPIRKLALPEGWFRRAEGHAYRGLVARALAGRSRGRVVEVGCWLGRSASFIARLCRARGAALTCVDTWAGSSDRFDAAYRERLAERDIAAEFQAHLLALGVAVDLRREPSIVVAHSFPRESVDLVFLDGSHDHAAIAADLAAWRPALRRGGTLAGHDFDERHPGVVAAVEAAAREHGCALHRGPGSLWWMIP